LHQDTLVRQNRRDFETKRSWQRACQSADELPGFEAWGALTASGLAAALVLVRIDDWFMLLSQNSLSETIRQNPNHALVYTVTKELMNRVTTTAIFYALQSFDASTSVDDFKFRMGYRPIIVRQRVVFNPVVSRLIAPWTLRAVQTLLRLNPSSPVVSKAAGLLRAHVHGKRPWLNSTSGSPQGNVGPSGSECLQPAVGSNR